MCRIECGHPGIFLVDVVSKSFLDVVKVVQKLESTVFVLSPTMCGDPEARLAKECGKFPSPNMVQRNRRGYEYESVVMP